MGRFGRIHLLLSIMTRFRLFALAVPLTLVLATLSVTDATAQSRREQRKREEKMAKLDAEIESRRAAAPVPDEGTTDMNGVDLHKKRQLEIIEARLNGGNTLGKPTTKDNQYEASSSGFTVRKFKPSKTARKQEKGYSPPAPGIDPPGKPLVHEQPKKHKFLFF